VWYDPNSYFHLRYGTDGRCSTHFGLFWSVWMCTCRIVTARGRGIGFGDDFPDYSVSCMRTVWIDSDVLTVFCNNIMFFGCQMSKGSESSVGNTGGYRPVRTGQVFTLKVALALAQLSSCTTSTPCCLAYPFRQAKQQWFSTPPRPTI
jgi:hypothetical protein